MGKWLGMLAGVMCFVVGVPMAATAQPPQAEAATAETGDKPQQIGPYWPGVDGAAKYPDGPVSLRRQEKPVGPGVWEEGFGDGAAGEASMETGSFLDAPIPNPVVKPVQNYSYEQMAADIQKLQARYGQRMQVNILGKSYDGRDIYEVVIGNVNAPKHILLQGAIHAREHMTSLLLMNQIETALFYHDTGQYEGRALQEMFQQAALHIIPMSNPDGAALSQMGLAGIHSDALKEVIELVYARDTALLLTSSPIEDYLARWKSNGAGVDLNHNFPADWEKVESATGENSYAGYRGTSPLSEPESQALASIADTYPWACTISYHAMGNTIYWDSLSSRTKEASVSLAQSLSAVTGYPLDESPGKGGYKDWMQSKENPVPGVTLEVGSAPCPLPLSQYEAIWQQNKAVWAQAMKWALEL